ncbi:MAG: glutamyl-tRNA reductase, partial [Spirochaetales bacterium]|nr:glutamyl-tRNA reductase [Spirochaetales bacterium]
MIEVIGINHETAPLKIRENLTFSDMESILFLEQLKEIVGDIEAVLVSTCNRTEIYYYINASCPHKYSGKFISLLIRNRKLARETESYFYIHSNNDAVLHLLRVAAGLESMVIGENQILGQLKSAYRTGSENNMTGTVINRLFHKAFEAGKKVRTETEINEGASSVGFAGVELAHKIFGELENNPVLLIGAGETGELVLQSLKSRGSKYISIINRTKSRAERLSAKFEVEVEDFEALEKTLIESDIVITSTSAGKVLLDKNLISKVMKKRRKKLFLLIDLSVPRNIDESVRDIPNTFLFNMDDLKQIVSFNNNKRRAAVKKAEI